VALKGKSRGHDRHPPQTWTPSNARSHRGWRPGAEGHEVTILDQPLREHIDVPVRESLIVELYSK